MSCTKPAKWAITHGETTLRVCETHREWAKARLVPTLHAALTTGRPLVVPVTRPGTCGHGR
jgi:hypothetical protein